MLETNRRLWAREDGFTRTSETKFAAPEPRSSAISGNIDGVQQQQRLVQKVEAKEPSVKPVALFQRFLYSTLARSRVTFIPIRIANEVTNKPVPTETAPPNHIEGNQNSMLGHIARGP